MRLSSAHHSARETGPAMARSSLGRSRRITAAVVVATALGLVTAPGAALAESPAGPVVSRAGLDPALVAGRGADVGFLEQEAENAVTNGTVIGPGPVGVHAAGRGVRALGRAAGAAAVRRVHAAERGERDHRAVQHPRRTARGRHHRAAGRDRRRRAPADHDAHLAVRLALQPVPVHQRPGRRPAAPGLVDHRVLVRAGADLAATGHRQAVPPQPLLRRAAPAAGPHLPGRRPGAAHRPGP